ncbi:sll0787 family AIR synthase-like protein [Robbsia sp. KACC 23696]|uniref:sll0787 family AIR synthase-like protein n=1 Tax=Robbsia sp. KACC 23696 TaxID=3149231 RepID=UPI00325AF9DA
MNATPDADESGQRTDAALALHTLAEALRASRGLAHKRDIEAVMRALRTVTPEGTMPSDAILLGDDCAAIPDGDGYLLFAIEGFINAFVEQQPWFAGYCGIMVNVSDIYAMGGRPIAVVDALWSREGDAAQPILDGLRAASEVYGVPIVGGHSNRRTDRAQLAVSIIGRAKHLLSSFDARPGDHLVMAIDLRGRFEDPYPNWNASVGAPSARLRADLELLPEIAADGLALAAKDISMAGVIGTALMLLECSGVGATIDIDAIPRPADVPLLKWLSAFPSYGFLLSVRDAHLQEVIDRFARREIACAAIGRIDDSRKVTLTMSGASTPFWNFETDDLIGCGPGRGRRDG